MFSPTSVRMAKIDLKEMEELADQTEAKQDSLFIKVERRACPLDE